MPSTFVAQFLSNPSFVSSLAATMQPALFTKTSSLINTKNSVALQLANFSLFLAGLELRHKLGHLLRLADVQDVEMNL